MSGAEERSLCSTASSVAKESGFLVEGDNIIEAGPIRTGSSRSRSCKSELCVGSGSRGVPKYPLHQGLGLHPGAQEGSRGMEESTPEAKTTSALRSDAFSQDQAGTVLARMASSDSKVAE